MSDPPGAVRLSDGSWVTTALSSVRMSEAGARRFLTALEGRLWPTIVPLDEERVLIAGGSLPTTDVESFVLELLSDQPPRPGVPLPGDDVLIRLTLTEIDRALADAELGAADFRYASPDAVIVRVN